MYIWLYIPLCRDRDSITLKGDFSLRFLSHIFYKFYKSRATYQIVIAILRYVFKGTYVVI